MAALGREGSRIMRKASLVLLSAVAGIGLTLLVITAPSGVPLAGAAKAAATDTYSQLTLFGEVFERIRSEHVEKPDDAKLIEAAINGMMSAIDPHSRYLNDEAWRDMQVTTRGQFGGLGIDVTMEDGLVKVGASTDGAPAARAGIRPGDLITHIDGDPVRGRTLEQVADKMRGPINSKIRLKILRKGTDRPIDMSITREIIRVPTVRHHVDGQDVGYVQITQFNEHTSDELKEAISDISRRIPPEKLAGYVVDLRNNPGGLLDQAIAVSEGFLDRGEIVATRGRKPEETQRFTARAGDLTRGKPLIVLINGGSASAAEIVAGALHDHKRATLVGTRSFGKGSVQTLIPLGPGNGALALTTARYFTPSGRSIQAMGITPDVEVRQDVPDDPKVRADTPGEASMHGHLAAEGAEQTGSQSYVPPAEKDDKALGMAYNLLRGTTVNAAFPPSPSTAIPN
jgi:carboxyl-terminal processing protease